jgi:uncharacterized membrane protein
MLLFNADELTVKKMGVQEKNMLNETKKVQRCVYSPLETFLIFAIISAVAHSLRFTGWERDIEKEGITC